ncbi:uroporphyrinogen-III C-methyltransferase [Halomonas ramblicola]|uniref:uroporphyrinogen-III C-methyltransferase n=1 Tax=Halomonas ramblicola TaxID=747349 RepID=UPI0025B3D79D|nr:uroporphyrinogen-III C-methyltransferase [Halomonas ramblicola]MDN3522714.1 uroporphyrinogen-III C-methyltransferase [Halomonas ramblicola]
MSKQPHEQDEQKASSGAESATSGEGGKGSPPGRRRSRRYDKASQEKGARGQAAASKASGEARPEAAKGAGDESAASGKADRSGKQTTDKPTGDQPDRSGKQATDKPTGGQADQSGKQATDKPAGGQPDQSGKQATDKPAGGQPDRSGKQAVDKPSGSQADKGGKQEEKKAEPAKGSASSSAAPGKDGKQDRTPASRPVSGGSGGASSAPRPSGGGDGKGGKTGVVALVLVILLAIAAALFGWQAWQKLDAQQARIGELESRTSEAATATDLADLQERFEAAESEREAALEEAIETLQGEFADYRGEVDDTLDQVLAELASEQETDERDWLHAEAAYLLRLANQRLQLERDVEGAAALLRTADARLREADNPALVPVRREISSELAALDAVPRVDRTGLWLALNAQQEQIAGQPLAQDVEEIVADARLEEAPSGAWQQQLSRFGQELKDLVTVRHHDEALEALISPEQESYLRQSVRLVIEQAQLALLKEEAELFEASLDKALTLIEGYYDTDASGVQSVLQRLRELKGEAVRPELPDISGSQQALATFIERRFESRQGDEA